VHESYYRGYDENSISNSFSVSKSIVSLLVGCALDDGSIKSVDQPVSDFIPEFKNQENEKLTIKQLLTMSSGLNWDESYHNLFSVTTKAYYGDNLRQLIGNLKVTEKPGTKFKYLSGNTILLGLIIEKATGKKLSDYASEKLWVQIGASQDAVWSLDKKEGEEKAYCCFNTGARDFARIGQLILNKGKWNGHQLVSPKYIAEATSPATWLQGEDGKALNYYGFQFWLMGYRGQRVVFARGILGQYIFILPDKNMVIVRLGEKRCSLKTGIFPSDVYIWLNIAMELTD
jgi:CubicO group peptidase (beta-lactamase class C family)